MTLEPGTTIGGRFLVGDEHPTGGWRARDTRLGRDVLLRIVATPIDPALRREASLHEIVQIGGVSLAVFELPVGPPPRDRALIAAFAAGMLAAGAIGGVAYLASRGIPRISPPHAVTAKPLGDFAGCSSDPVFVDDHTIAFAHLGDRKPGIYTIPIDRADPPRWIWDGPKRERMLAPGGAPNTLAFLTDHNESLDLATATATKLVAPFDFFLSPFVIGTGPGNFLYVASAGRSLYEFRDGAARLLATLPAGEIVYFDALSADHRVVSLSGARGIYLVDLDEPNTFTRLAVRHTAYHRAPMSPDGGIVYYPNPAGISRYDRASLVEDVVVPGASAAGGLVLSPDGKTLVGSTCMPTGAAIDQITKRELFREALDWPVVAADGSWLYALRLPSGPIAARRTPDGHVIRLSPPELGQALTPRLSPDGREVAFAIDGPEPGIYLVPSDGAAPPRLVAPDGGHYPMWLPDGRLAYAKPDDAGEIRIFAVGSSTPIHPRSRRLADVTTTGDVLLTNGSFTDLYRWNPATGEETAIALDPALANQALAVVRASRDGRFALVTTGLLETIWRIDLRGTTPPERLRTGNIEDFAGAVYVDDHEVVVENTPRGTLWRADLD